MGGALDRTSLEQLQEHIHGVLEQQRALDGFYVANVIQDRATESVLLRVVTARSDAQAHFVAKFGPRVRTEGTGDRVECHLAADSFSG